LLSLKNRRSFIHLTLIVAILSVAISPACAFVSGKYGDWIEICSGLTTQKIQNNVQSEVPNMTQNGCEFCFQKTHFAGVETIAITLGISKYTMLIGGFIDEVALITFHGNHHARAPPVFS
jgi:hypothetical protein